MNPALQNAAAELITKFSKGIDVAAQKMGVAGQALWIALCKKAMMLGIADLVTALILALIFIPLLVFFWKKINKIEDNEEAGFAIGILIVGSMIFCAIFFSYLRDGIMETFAPDYYAAQEVLQTIQSFNTDQQTQSR